MTHAHTHADGTTHVHDHEEHHEHDPIELATIDGFVKIVSSVEKGSEAIKTIAVQEFIKVFNNVNGIVDCFIHNAKFREACKDIGINICYGRKVDRHRLHAYAVKYAQEEGAICTLQTNINFEKYDKNFPWANYDLFDDSTKG